MSISNLTKTSFGSDPTAGLEVVDIYKSEAFTALMEKGTVTVDDVALIEEIYPDFPTDKVIGYLNDEELQGYLTTAGTTLKKAWSALDASLPRNVFKSDLLNKLDFSSNFDFDLFDDFSFDGIGSFPEFDGFDLSSFGDFKFDGLSGFKFDGFGDWEFDGLSGFDLSSLGDWDFGDLGSDFEFDGLGDYDFNVFGDYDFEGFGCDLGIGDLFKWAPELKDSLDPGIFNNLSTDDYSSFMRTLKSYKNKYDIDDIASTSSLRKSWAKLSGKDSGSVELIDSVLKSSNTLTIAGKLIDSGETADISTWIDSELENFEEKEDVYADLVPVAGANNEWDLLAEFITKAGDKLTDLHRTKAICAILYNYKMPDDALIETYGDKGTALLSYLDLVDDKWDVGLRGNKEVVSLNKILYANTNTLKVLAYTERCAEMALLARSTKLSVKSYKALMRRNYPALMLS